MNHALAAVAGVIVFAIVLLVLLFAAGPPPPAPALPRPAALAPVSSGIKADRLAIASAGPVEPLAVAPILEPPAVAPSSPKRKSKAFAFDICRGKGRYYTNGGKSWRCRR
jgi:hypothetical protein